MGTVFPLQSRKWHREQPNNTPFLDQGHYERAFSMELFPGQRQNGCRLPNVPYDDAISVFVRKGWRTGVQEDQKPGAHSKVIKKAIDEVLK
jgi:hypothetical protein